MNPYAFHAAALQKSLDLMGDACPVFTWNEEEYKIIPNTAMRRKDLASGGFQMNADFRFSCLVAPMLGDEVPDVATLKDELLQSEIAYLGDDYKPISVDILPGGLQLVVECNSLNQNA